jgi:hypothetical protein
MVSDVSEEPSDAIVYSEIGDLYCGLSSIVARFSQQSPAFDPRQVCVAYVVDRMALRQVFPRCFSFQYNSTEGHHTLLAVDSGFI